MSMCSLHLRAGKARKAEMDSGRGLFHSCESHVLVVQGFEELEEMRLGE